MSQQLKTCITQLEDLLTKQKDFILCVDKGSYHLSRFGDFKYSVEQNLQNHPKHCSKMFKEINDFVEGNIAHPPKFKTNNISAKLINSIARTIIKNDLILEDQELLFNAFLNIFNFSQLITGIKKVTIDAQDANKHILNLMRINIDKSLLNNDSLYNFEPTQFVNTLSFLSSNLEQPNEDDLVAVLPIFLKRYQEILESDHTSKNLDIHMTLLEYLTGNLSADNWKFFNKYLGSYSVEENDSQHNQENLTLNENTTVNISLHHTEISKQYNNLVIKPYIVEMNKLITNHLLTEDNKRILNINDLAVLEKESTTQLFISSNSKEPFNEVLFSKVYNAMIDIYSREKENKNIEGDIFKNVVMFNYLDNKVDKNFTKPVNKRKL